MDKWGRLLGLIVRGGLDINSESIREGKAVNFSQRKEGEIPNFNQQIERNKIK